VFIFSGPEFDSLRLHNNKKKEAGKLPASFDEHYIHFFFLAAFLVAFFATFFFAAFLAFFAIAIFV